MKPTIVLPPPPVDPEPQLPIAPTRIVIGDVFTRLRLREPIQINNMGARELRTSMDGNAGRYSSNSDVKEVVSITIGPKGYVIEAMPSDRDRAAKMEFVPVFLIPVSMVQYAVPSIVSEP